MIFTSIGWLVLLFAGMPVAFSLGVVSVLWLAFDTSAGGSTIGTAPQRMVAGLNSFPLLAVPFFVLAGQLMNLGGISDRIYGFASMLVGHVRGGLAHVNILGSLIFSGMSGSAIADAGGLGTIEIRAMVKEGYPRAFAGALTCASCILGPLIPPSLPMVVYGVIANVSAGRLFLGGIGPGLLTALALAIHVSILAHRRGWAPSRARPSWREAGSVTASAFWPLLTPAIIMGGIFGGIFTPTEAAVAAALYALVLGIAYRELTWPRLLEAARETIGTTAAIGFIVATASLASWILAREQVPQAVAELFVSWGSSATSFLLVLNVLLLVLGCVMEATAIMILVVPVILPTASLLGIDPVHLGVVVVLNLMVGLLTPPFGVGLFVVSRVGEIPLDQLTRATLPFLVPLLTVLGIVTFWPPATTFLPNLVFGLAR